MDLGGAAVEGFLQRDFQIVAQVLAAVRPLAAALAAHHLAEDVLEHIAEAAGEIPERRAAARTGRSAHAAFKGGVAIAVIGSALVVVLQDVIGLVDFLELDLGGVVAGIFVRMEFHRHLAIGGLQHVAIGATLDFQGLVITALGTHARLNSPPSLTSEMTPSGLRWLESQLRPPPPLMRLRAEGEVGAVLTSWCRRLLRSRRPPHCRPQGGRHRRRHPRRRLRTAATCTWPRPASSKPGPGCWSWP